VEASTAPILKRMGWMLDDRGRATGEVVPVTGLHTAGSRLQHRSHETPGRPHQPAPPPPRPD